jgi:integrase
MGMINRLTANKVRNAKPRADGGDVALCDGGGLYLQISVSKTGQVLKSWVFRYATPGTKISKTGREYRAERQMGLGPLYTVGLADAREMAREARLLLVKGIDPIDHRDASRASARAAQAKRTTFDQATEEYLQRFESNWKSGIHRSQWRSTLRDFVSPIIGSMDVEKIETEDVLRVLTPIWSRIPETASRVRGRIEVLLDFAGRNGSNPARWAGHLEHRLPARNKRRDVEHLPALPYDDVAEFMTELRAVDSIPARALEFTILTACRSNEVLGATWHEIDFAARLWTIPAARTKRDREHVVPLSDAAIAVLESMDAIRQDARVFSICKPAMREIIKKLRPGVSVHGMRACFRSWAGACTAHPRDVCELSLGHSIGDATEQAYLRESLLAKRRVLMSDWAEYCGKRTATVIRMDRQEATSIPAA